MSLLLVVVLLFFSSSWSVSPGQYYVSDDCSSVTQSPCNPLSVYAGNMSQYNNTIFYFIGTTNIEYYVFNMSVVKNVTLHGLDRSPSINCKKVSQYIHTIVVHYSDHVTISNLSISYCTVKVDSSNNLTIINSVFASDYVNFHSSTISNSFDVKVSSVSYTGFNGLDIEYHTLPVCSSELLHYSLILTDVTFTMAVECTYI